MTMRAVWKWALVGTCVAAITLALVLGTLLSSDWGRDRVREQVNARISAAIMGRIVVDRIEDLSFSQVTASGVSFLAPDGSLVIRADHAIVDFEPLALLSGRYGFRRAVVKGGEVHVTQNRTGSTNMEDTFRARAPAHTGGQTEDSKLDLRDMVTSDIVLTISGGTLPNLRLVNIDGIMRVNVPANGSVELRFDEYRGNFVKGLPTGTLNFRDVTGHVDPGHKRLLHFDGQGKSAGARVRFALDVFTKPRDLVKIEATFPELSASAMSTLGIATWSRLSPSLEVDVRFGK